MGRTTHSSMFLKVLRTYYWFCIWRLFLEVLGGPFVVVLLIEYWLVVCKASILIFVLFLWTCLYLLKEASENFPKRLHQFIFPSTAHSVHFSLHPLQLLLLLSSLHSQLFTTLCHDPNHSLSKVLVKKKSCLTAETTIRFHFLLVLDDSLS